MHPRAEVLLGRLVIRRCVGLITHLPNFCKLFGRLVRDPRVSVGPKLLLVLVAAYLVFPADLLPDFLLGVGQIDDLLLMYLGLKYFIRLCPKDIVEEHVKSIAVGR